MIPFSELKDATNCYESVENIGRMSYLKITLHPPSTDIKQEGTKTNEDQQEIASSPKNEALFDIDIEGDHPPSTDNTDPMNVNMSFESFKSLENDELLKINEFYFAFRTKRAEVLCYQILSNLSFSNFLHNDSDVHYIVKIYVFFYLRNPNQIVFYILYRMMKIPRSQYLMMMMMMMTKMTWWMGNMN